LRGRFRSPFRRPDLLLRYAAAASLSSFAVSLVALVSQNVCGAFGFDDVALRARQVAAA
jgi:hypothetical protein